VFIGPNGSGKSTPLQALMLLKQSIGHGGLRLDTPLNMGLFEGLLSTGRDRRRRVLRLGIGFSGTLSSEVLGGDVEAAYLYDCFFTNSGTDEVNVTFQLNGTRAKSSWRRATGADRASLPVGPRASLQLLPGPTVGVGFRVEGITYRGGSRPEDQQTAEARRDLLLPILQSFPEDALTRVSLVPAMRGLSNPTYRLIQEFPTDLSSVPSAQRAETVSGSLAHYRDAESQVSRWMEAITGVRLRGRVEPRLQSAVEVETPAGAFNLIHEGFGSNQLTDLLLHLALTPKGSIVAIEEPEIHLHPKAQFALADVLREVAISQNKQIIITTHSEHILYKFLTSVASKQLNLSDFGVLYFKKDKDVTTVERLEIDEKGRVKGGLPGFFEAELGQLSNYIGALSRKK
jgi:predicted ATPase